MSLKDWINKLPDKQISIEPEQNEQFGKLLAEHNTEMNIHHVQLLFWKQHMENSKKKGKKLTTGGIP